MSVSRRSVLKGASALGAATALPLAATAKPPAFAIYDSRLPEARLFARAQRRKGIRIFDIAPGDSALRALARADLAAAGPVIGLTGWSDWVTVRGLLEERGLRMQTEARVDARLSKFAHLFRWEMA